MPDSDGSDVVLIGWVIVCLGWKMVVVTLIGNCVVLITFFVEVSVSLLVEVVVLGLVLDVEVDKFNISLVGKFTDESSVGKTKSGLVDDVDCVVNCVVDCIVDWTVDCIVDCVVDTEVVDVVGTISVLVIVCVVVVDVMVVVAVVEVVVIVVVVVDVVVVEVVVVVVEVVVGTSSSL